MKTIYLTAFIFLLFSCTKKEGEIPTITTPSPGIPWLGSATEDAVCIGEKDCGHMGMLGWPTLDLRDATLKAITLAGRELLDLSPKDATEYCPQYKNLGLNARRRFYVALFAALAKFESAYKDNVAYEEACYVKLRDANGKEYKGRIPETKAPKGCGIKDAQGKYVVSRGQLQISKESANSYGCKISDSKELHDPKVNIECGNRIAKKWIAQDGVIAGGSSGAWKGMARYWSPFRKSDRIAEIKKKTRAACALN